MSRSIKNIIKKLFLLIIILLIGYFLNNYDLPRNVTELRQTPIELSNKEDFKIYFIDVGQADCTLIQDKDEYMLIDGGNNQDGKKLVTFFKNLGIKKFKYVVATHAHEDHIGGLDYIIREFDIDHFFMPKTKTNYTTYKEVIKELKNKNITLETPEVDSSYDFSNSNFKILSIKDDKEDLNNTSIVLKLTFKNTSYLFMGDATNEVEREILDKDLKSNLLKVGHHGSRYSTSAHFLKAVYPEYAIISVGKDNEYGLPKQVTIDKLNRINAKIYRTDQDGTIVASSDGQNIYIETIQTDTDGNKKN